jgi:prevent-host-death family protein
MTVSTIHQAKTNLSRLIARAERGEEVLIARGKKPVVRLAPVKKPSAKRQLGLHRGEFTVGSEFFEPLPPEELDAWE